MSKTNTLYQETIHVRDTCLCLHVQRAARALARLFDDGLREHGLTHGQFSTLNALNRPEPATSTEVCRLLGMDRTTLTAALKPLQRDHLVAITRDPSDARSRRIALTKDGIELLTRAIPTWRRLHAELDVKDPESLREALNALAKG